MRTTTFAALCALVLAALLPLPACTEKPRAAAGAAGAPPEHAEHDAHAEEVKLTADAALRHGIRLGAVSAQVLTPTLLAPARVSFNAEAIAQVGSPLRGRATELKVRLGDLVKKGDALLVIESPELGEAQSEYLQKRSAARSAVPVVDLARNAHERARALYDKTQGIALSEVQRREAEYRGAEAGLLAAQTAAMAAENKLYMFGMDRQSVAALAASAEVVPRFAITAPIDGRVVQREVTLGELVSPEKQALLVLANLDTLWVLADVPEARLQDIAVGGKVRVAAGSGEGATFNGTVAFISPAVDPSTRSAQVRIEVRSERVGEGDGGHGGVALRPGMFARVEIDCTLAGKPAAAVLAVPDEAVQTVEGGPVVFVPVPGEENTFAKRSVKVGKAVGGMVPVLSGLSAGESVVVAGSFILKAELGKGSAEQDH